MQRNVDSRMQKNVDFSIQMAARTITFSMHEENQTFLGVVRNFQLKGNLIMRRNE